MLFPNYVEFFVLIGYYRDFNIFEGPNITDIRTPLNNRHYISRTEYPLDEISSSSAAFNLWSWVYVGVQTIGCPRIHQITARPTALETSVLTTTRHPADNVHLLMLFYCNIPIKIWPRESMVHIYSEEEEEENSNILTNW